MREFELIIDEAFKNGLSPESKLPFNSQFLYRCLGFRCGRAGLERHGALGNPLPVTVDMHYNWPFPQFLTGELYNILVIRDNVLAKDIVYSVNDDHSVVSLVASVNQGTLMEVADFGEYIFMTNGVIIIYWNPALAAWATTTATIAFPMLRTVCNFNGQLVGGNVVSVWHDCDETFYVWSKIGSADFAPWIDNEAGYRRCPYGGEVYHTRKLGDIVVGYSSKGIVAIYPVSSPVPGYGFKEFSNIGVINRGAVGTGLMNHIYVGEDYILREVTKEGVKELGYQSYMEELGNVEDIIVNYDPANEDFYISNSSKTYLLSPNGLTEVMQHPSAVWRRDNESYMLPDAEDLDKPYLCTEVFDMGYKGQKTIFSMESDAMLVTGPEAGIDYANDLTTWHNEFYKPINNMGIAAITTAGNMFRFRLKFSTVDEETVIGYLRARYKMTDLRGIRGVYAPPPRGQR